MEYISGEGIVPGILHFIKQLTLNGRNIYVGDESYVDTACNIQVDTDLYYKYVKLAGVELKNKMTDNITMCGLGNPLITVT